MGGAAGLGPSAWPGRAETARTMAVPDRPGLVGLAHAGITRLSGGQRQRVLIVGAPAQEAHAVIMDEPSPSLDFANRLQVNALVRGLAGEGTAAILWTHDPRPTTHDPRPTTHDPDRTAALGDRALLLNRGGVIAFAAVAQALAAANLTRLYGMAVRCGHSPDERLHFH